MNGTLPPSDTELLILRMGALHLMNVHLPPAQSTMSLPLPAVAHTTTTQAPATWSTPPYTICSKLSHRGSVEKAPMWFLWVTSTPASAVMHRLSPVRLPAARWQTLLAWFGTTSPMCNTLARGLQWSRCTPPLHLPAVHLLPVQRFSHSRLCNCIGPPRRRWGYTELLCPPALCYQI